jgi:hypothetical protein
MPETWDLMQFLNQNYLTLVPVLWILGFALKRTPFIPDWSIIWVLVAVSIVAGGLVYGFSSEAIINGIIAAGVAVFGHQMKKQTLEGNNARLLKKKK